MSDAWYALVGPEGWRTVAWPATFAAAALGLLVFDHLQDRIPQLVFWLCVALIACVFVWLVETARRKDRDLSVEQQLASVDQVTGLANRAALLRDLGWALGSGERWALIVVELDGLQSFYDGEGAAAGDALLCDVARPLAAAVERNGGWAYRIDAARFGILASGDSRTLGEIMSVALSPPSDEDHVPQVGRSHGEVTLPDETSDPEVALQLAGQRVTAYKQRQQRSARRQAHAVLMAALGARRPDLRQHVRDVAFRSIAISRRMGLDGDAIDDVFLAAELQDIGLLTVPEAVLEKPTSLDDAESRLIRRHPIEGERIVSAAPGLAPVARIIRSISERYDGSGFPDGLSGEAIPVGARIIAAVVAYAAMTSPRPYRAARSDDDAIEELRLCAGSQFDPTVVEALAADLVSMPAVAAPVAPTDPALLS
ncbi:MAG TPA: HD domain-containing phosphohydrolase [Solirubrobacterales bacterium]|jgi:GGDEF domain-containing protein|nr:HD domain-containing phosphohydrolase [Solirubrobacterales bacterium]